MIIWFHQNYFQIGNRDSFLPNFKYQLTVGVCYLSLIGSMGFQYQAADGGSYIGILPNLWILIWRRFILKEEEEKYTFMMNLVRKKILTSSLLATCHQHRKDLVPQPFWTLAPGPSVPGDNSLPNKQIIRNKLSISTSIEMFKC